MDRYRPPVGTPVKELDTPCLLVDLEALESNYQTVARAYEGSGVKMRQHSKNIKTPLLAHLQMRMGGSIGGVCTAKVAEAEVMVEGGIRDVLVTSQVATRDKLARLCGLAKRATIAVSVDDPRNVQQLSRVASEHDVTVGVVIEVDTSMGRAGVRGADRAVSIARLASDLPGVAFKGVMSHQTLPGQPGKETRFREGVRYIEQCLAVKQAIEAEGIPVEVVSTGETWTYDVAASMPGITEVQGGTYALMGTNYTYMEDFRYAAKILASVVSVPDEHTAIGDVGVRALAAPGGVLPMVQSPEGVTVAALGANHIVLRSEGPMPLRVADQFVLISAQQDMLVNRWDQFIAVRDGIVEAVWDIPGRGCHH